MYRFKLSELHCIFIVFSNNRAEKTQLKSLIVVEIGYSCYVPVKLFVLEWHIESGRLSIKSIKLWVLVFRQI